MFPGSVSKVSGSLSYLLIWCLAFSYHGQSAALVAERLHDRSTDPSIWAHSATIIPRIPGEIVSRVPAATWIQDLGQRWPGIWTGETKCQSAPDVWSRVVAQEAYTKMKAEDGTNLIVAFCIHADSCFVASIPRIEDQTCTNFIKAEMDNDPEWKQAFGNSGRNKYHAEDLAIALAVRQTRNSHLIGLRKTGRMSRHLCRSTDCAPAQLWTNTENPGNVGPVIHLRQKIGPLPVPVSYRS
ncbi:hypothetical protein B0J14DRAFT_661449 [Halenospora varia]|nr:hypothetical protein B0J14DRAFT_661449 [Halenospora varia]